MIVICVVCLILIKSYIWMIIDLCTWISCSVNETELERLKNALRLLSEAEKQLRTSSERSTWFTATLLQLGSVPSSDLTQSSSSRRQSCKTTEDDPSSTSRDITSFKHKSDLQYTPHNSTSPASHQKAVNGISGLQMDTSSLKSKPSNSPVINDGSTVVSSDDLIVGNAMFRCIDSGKLCDIWACCIEKCHSKTLRQLLHNHGKLVSISEVQGKLIVFFCSKFIADVLASNQMFFCFKPRSTKLFTFKKQILDAFYCYKFQILKLSAIH